MHRLLTRLLAVALAALAVAVSAGPAAAKEKAKSIDVVICLDVSNSMDGLIDSAKARLWDVVNDLAQIKPTPNLRVGLYSYGNDNYDARIGWIRKEVDLTSDLDAISQKLFALTTQGGTEYVTRVCRDALEQQKWRDDKDALKLIFVCGNEPASQDPVVKLKDAAGLAKKKGVIVNPIYCGNAGDADARDWKEYAQLCGGKFTNIDQSRSTVAVKTPVDARLSQLSFQLNQTYLAYGKDGVKKLKNQADQDKNAEKLQGAAQTRAAAKAGGLYRTSDWDLVDRLARDPKFDVKKVPVDQLSQKMKKMKPEEREKYVKEQLAKRQKIQKEIVKLSKERADYVKRAEKTQLNHSGKAFSDALREVIREQAAKKGITVPK
jgi:hypothetical protein